MKNLFKGIVLLLAISSMVMCVADTTKKTETKTTKKTDAQKQADIVKYFGDVGHKNRKISIPSVIPITDNVQLLFIIKDLIGEGLTDEQKESITKKSTFVPLIKGTETNVVIQVKVGSETPKDITLKVTHVRPTNAEKQADIVKYFDTAAKKKISIPSATVITNKDTLLAAIKAEISLTDDQKNAITIPTYVALTPKGTKVEVIIQVQVGSEKAENIALNVTHLAAPTN